MEGKKSGRWTIFGLTFDLLIHFKTIKALDDKTDLTVIRTILTQILSAYEYEDDMNAQL